MSGMGERTHNTNKVMPGKRSNSFLDQRNIIKQFHAHNGSQSVKNLVRVHLNKIKKRELELPVLLCQYYNKCRIMRKYSIRTNRQEYF